MAAETSTVNGLYDTQFSQPAELAASTPSHAVSVSQNSATQASTQQQQKADPQEIGWYFVEQYYTTLSKTPDRIHLFYTKKSQLVTGMEAERVLTAVGSKAISEKIKSLDIQDCKVRVLNVDSQSSYDNIVVQVIGEMSNKSEPHHKFVQTFILATQPGGYFVLNDIFRYLTDDVDEIVDDEPAQEEVAAEPATAQAEPVAAVEEAASVEETAATEEPAEEVDEKSTADTEEPAVEEESAVNGDDASAAQEASVVDDKAEDEPAVEESVPPTAEETPAVEAAAVQPTTPQAQPQAPVTDAPPARKTWASMVGNKAPAIPALPAAAVPATAAPNKQQKPAPVAQSNAPAAAAQAPATETAAETSPVDAPSNGWQMADHGKKAKSQQAKSTDNVVYAFIKNVNEKIESKPLREVLEKFGEVSYLDISRPKSCAFVEFKDQAGFAAAVAANPHTVGSEQVAVEERRRPGAFGAGNGQFNRGGGNAGRGRGGLQQRPGGQNPGVGRGGFQPRGKPGNATPRGRGQPQPS